MLNARMFVHGWLGLRLGGSMWLFETRFLLDCQSDNCHFNSLPTVYDRLFLETEQKPTDLGQESKPQTCCAPKPSIALYLTNSNSPLALAVTLTSPPLTLIEDTESLVEGDKLTETDRTSTLCLNEANTYQSQ